MPLVVPLVGIAAVPLPFWSDEPVIVKILMRVICRKERLKPGLIQMQQLIDLVSYLVDGIAS